VDRDSVISPRHALTSQELGFCKIYAANSYKRPGDAYRQSFMERNLEGEWVEPPRPDLTRDEILGLKPLAANQINKKANNLLKQDKIRDYVDWLSARPGDIAQNAITEQALFGEQSVQMRAAETLLDLEDKLSKKDDFERWAEIMCQVGTEVVVDLGGGKETVFPLSEFFPTYKGQLPPKDALVKTRNALTDYIVKYHPDNPDND
jgi:hypothetical protein